MFPRKQGAPQKTVTNDLICFETFDLTIPPTMGSDPSLSPTAGV